ncbi:MAG TPA: chemotaxis protein CheW [Clostridia bacterium]|nr:chemotaxis protein CheW [Clostridia bacterium]
MQVLIFIVRGEKYAIPTDLVETIENRAEMTIIPKSHEILMGLASIRGDVVPVINAGIILEEKLSDGREKLIVIAIENERYALAVDDVDDVLEVSIDHLKKVNEDKSLSVIQFEDELIYLIPSRLFEKINI